MKYILLTVFIFLSQNLFSQTGGETVYAFLNTPTSPKQIALGGVTLTTRNDVSQVLWNPSAVNSQVDGDVSVNFVNYIADINVGSLVYARSIKPEYGTAFLGVQYFGYGDLERTDASGPDVLGTFSARDIAFNLGYGYTYKQVTFGITAKYISSKIDTYTSSAFLYDLGITYLHPELPFIVSIVVRNSGKQLTKYLDREEEVGKNVIMAAEYSLEHVPIKLYGAIDDISNWAISEPNPSREKTDLNDNVTEENISDVDNALRHLSIGAELWPEKKLNLRIGYNHRRSQEFQLSEARTGAGLSYGFGINTKYIKFDYAFAKFQEGAKYSTFGLTLHL
ncbi:hypothetical protein FHR24_002624 [Wenyingzhuangia heitensis]|uniref:Type IX secretion system protein PorQ n=1 Tax=Wenyingzhuangia heitensis TaxID=1487859 RepID=A0ABX0UF31_9FLAO|nr:type IX secretion system protein PorQ [Wenyingzhuangia heitensis]NIJ46146.1 hypothetical protein [Wenyingzhuangia heitensis]